MFLRAVFDVLGAVFEVWGVSFFGAGEGGVFSFFLWLFGFLGGFLVGERLFGKCGLGLMRLAINREEGGGFGGCGGCGES